MQKVIPYLVAVSMIVVMIWQATVPDAVLMPVPELTFPEFDGATVEELTMSEAEERTLPKDTIVRRRRYHFANGHWMQLTAVIGGRSKSSVHRPELCLPGQGFQMTDPRTAWIGGISWRLLTLEHGGDGKAGFAYTFSNGNGFRTSSHLVRIFSDVWNRSIHGRIDRWVMVTVSTSFADESALRAILEKTGGVVK